MTLLRVPKNSAARSAALIGVLLLASSAHAAGIDPAHKYAWNDAGGWVNFAPSQSTVVVSDDALSGYAWSANDGWLNLAPTSGGVLNDGAGNLSGFAWDESLGWVSFAGVTIDSSGRFHGQAAGANEAITFDCTNCDVETDWRPASAGTRDGNASEGHGTSGSGDMQVTNEATIRPGTEEINPPIGSERGSANIASYGVPAYRPTSTTTDTAVHASSTTAFESGPNTGKSVSITTSLILVVLLIFLSFVAIRGALRGPPDHDP